MSIYAIISNQLNIRILKNCNHYKKYTQLMKSIDKQLDENWSLAVKAKAGFKCEYCGITNGLNSHHIFSRAKKSVRWSLDNGICLCVNHHVGSGFSAHKTPVTFTAWLIRKKGQQFIDLLTAKSNQIGKFTEFEKKEKLKELREFINKTK